MKKFFIIIATALMTVGAMAQKQTILEYSFSAQDSINLKSEPKVDSIALDNGGIKLGVTTIEKKTYPAYAAKITGSQYVDIFLNEKLSKGDEVKFMYFVTSNAKGQDSIGIKAYDKKYTTEGAQVLATMYVQPSDKKNIVTYTYTAAGTEKRFNLASFAKGAESGSVYFAGFTITHDASEAIESTVDLTTLNTLDGVKAATSYTGAEVTYSVAEEEYSSEGSTESKTKCIWTNAAGLTATFAFKDFPMMVSYKNSSAKGFMKAYEGYLQPNSKDITFTITCKAGQCITIYPYSYTKDGSANITGADVTSISIPTGSTDPVVMTATSSEVVVKIVGSFCMSKISITNSPSAVSAVPVSTVKANNVVKTVNGIVKNGKKYNFAGQLMK